MAEKFSGAEWIERQGKQVSPFGRKVANILGQIYRGIYHISQDALRADWSTEDYINLTLYGGRDYSTFDGATLTELVVLFHDACIRMEMQPAGPRYFRFLFHPRERGGNLYQRMPTMEDHIENIRKQLSIEEIR